MASSASSTSVSSRLVELVALSRSLAANDSTSWKSVLQHVGERFAAQLLSSRGAGLGACHIYCERRPLRNTDDIITFMIHANAPPEWWNCVEQCLTNCSDCVRGYLRARRHQSKGFFPKFDAQDMERHDEAVANEELKMLLTTLPDDIGHRVGMRPFTRYLPIGAINLIPVCVRRGRLSTINSVLDLNVVDALLEHLQFGSDVGASDLDACLGSVGMLLDAHQEDFWRETRTQPRTVVDQILQNSQTPKLVNEGAQGLCLFFKSFFRNLDVGSIGVFDSVFRLAFGAEPEADLQETSAGFERVPPNPRLMDTMIKAATTLYRLAYRGAAEDGLARLTTTVEKYSDNMCCLAFDTTLSGEAWSRSKGLLWAFFEQILVSNSKRAEAVLRKLYRCQLPSTSPTANGTSPNLRYLFYHNLWNSINLRYRRTNDTRALRLILRVAASWAALRPFDHVSSFGSTVPGMSIQQSDAMIASTKSYQKAWQTIRSDSIACLAHKDSVTRKPTLLSSSGVIRSLASIAMSCPTSRGRASQETFHAVEGFSTDAARELTLVLRHYISVNPTEVLQGVQDFLHGSSRTTELSIDDALAAPSTFSRLGILYELFDIDFKVDVTLVPLLCSACRYLTSIVRCLPLWSTSNCVPISEVEAAARAVLSFTDRTICSLQVSSGEVAAENTMRDSLGLLYEAVVGWLRITSKQTSELCASTLQKIFGLYKTWGLRPPSEKAIAVIYAYRSGAVGSLLSDGDYTHIRETLIAINSAAKQREADAQSQRLAASLKVPPSTSQPQSSSLSATGGGSQTIPLDAGGFWKSVLSWTPQLSSNAALIDLPEEIEQVDDEPLPTSYTSSEDYIKAFAPLILLESCASICEALADTASRPPRKADWFLEEIGEVSGVTGVAGGPWMQLRLSSSRAPSFTSTDVLAVEDPSNRGRKLRPVLAKVSSSSSRPQRNLDGRTTVYLFCQKPSQEADRVQFHVGQEYAVHQLHNASTDIREYEGLAALAKSNWMKQLIDPTEGSVPESPSEDEVQRVMSIQNLTHAQAVAVLSALRENRISVIQGPPGTGKTTAICAYIGELLSIFGYTGASLADPPPPTSTSRKERPKILVCGPSNAAVDNLIRRIQDGVLTSTGTTVYPRVVRSGPGAGADLVQLSTESLAKLGTTEAREVRWSNIGARIRVLSGELEIRKGEMDSLSAEDVRIGELEEKCRQISEELEALERAHQEFEDLARQRSANTVDDSKHRSEWKAVLKEADIIGCTLSSSGHYDIPNQTYAAIIVDEAAQSVEPATLIPLRHGTSRLVLVGDHRQLPPTVKSKKSKDKGYDRSLFQRLVMARGPESTHLLDTQFRMHPKISVLPFELFYGGKVKDGEDMDKITARPWHSGNASFPEYLFYDINDGVEGYHGSSSQSLFNQKEIDAVVAIYKKIVSAHSPDGSLDGRIGIITAYQGQLQRLRTRFTDEFGKAISEKVQMDTVDAFQGQEKDIIIVSFVRTGRNLGFVDDEQRLNVATTRARCSLCILGNATALARGSRDLRRFVEHASDTRCLFRMHERDSGEGRPFSLVFSETGQIMIAPRDTEAQA